MRLAVVNVGMLVGRSREVVEMLGRRNVEVCCLQEVRYTGQGTRMFGSEYKFWKARCGKTRVHGEVV